MKTTHLFEDGYYHIGNSSVSKSFMFRDAQDCLIIKNKIDRHLSPFCDIMAYAFQKDDFQLVIKIKSRMEIEDKYRELNPKLSSEYSLPETTYIIAQAMANMQSGYAKCFNYKYNRKGALMAGRYFRHLIESEMELKNIIARVHKENLLVEKSSIWTFRRRGDGYLFEEIGDGLVKNSSDVYGGKRAKEETGISSFKQYSEVLLRGDFEFLPPKQITWENSDIKLHNLVKFMLLKQ